MPLCGFDDLFHQADERQQRMPVAVVGGADPTVLEAVRVATDRGWITPWVLDPEANIRLIAPERNLGLHGINIISTENPAAAAAAEVQAGRAALLMKGQVATPTLMKALLDPEHGLRTGRVICQVVLMEVRLVRLGYITGPPRRFLLADTGVCIQPTLDQKIDILRSCVDVAQVLGAETPRVALMAATETVTDAMPETLEAAELQKRGAAGELGACWVQGPLSFDLAFTAKAAAKKQVTGVAAGAADVMLFPNLLSANLTVKAIMYTAKCRFGGVLCGARCPVVFMSRADATETRLNSLALALKMAAA